MKKLVQFFAFSCMLFAFDMLHAQDQITSVTAPDQVSPGQTMTVTVNYNASKSREIIVVVQEYGGNWKSYAWEKAKVKAGQGSIEVPVAVSKEIPLASDAYKIGVALIPVGGNFPDRLDEYTKPNIDAVHGKTEAAPAATIEQADDIIRISAPDKVTPGETITIDVEYKASDSRDILVNLQLNKAPWTNYGATKISVKAGAGSKKIALTVSKDIPQASSSYNLSATIVPVSKSWPDRLDSFTKGKIDAVSNQN